MIIGNQQTAIILQAKKAIEFHSAHLEVHWTLIRVKDIPMGLAEGAYSMYQMKILFCVLRTLNANKNGLK